MSKTLFVAKFSVFAVANDGARTCVGTVLMLYCVTRSLEKFAVIDLFAYGLRAVRTHSSLLAVVHCSREVEEDSEALHQISGTFTHVNNFSRRKLHLHCISFYARCVYVDHRFSSDNWNSNPFAIAETPHVTDCTHTLVRTLNFSCPA